MIQELSEKIKGVKRLSLVYQLYSHILAVKLPIQKHQICWR